MSSEATLRLVFQMRKPELPPRTQYFARCWGHKTSEGQSLEVKTLKGAGRRPLRVHTMVAGGQYVGRTLGVGSELWM